MLVAVAVRPDAGQTRLTLPGGRWRDVLRGDERSFDSGETANRVLGEDGLAVYERLGVE